MLPQGDLRIHAGKVDVAAVVFPWAVAVEQDIVCLADLLPPFRVFPYPLRKRLLQQLLLALCNGCFLFVEHRHTPSVRVVLVIENTDIL